jgi:hypothetical protein
MIQINAEVRGYDNLLDLFNERMKLKSSYDRWHKLDLSAEKEFRVLHSFKYPSTSLEVVFFIHRALKARLGIGAQFIIYLKSYHSNNYLGIIPVPR